MTAPTRRALLGVCPGVLLAGCVGPDLRYEDEPHPITGDDTEEEFGAAEREGVIDFSRASTAFLAESDQLFRDWADNPDEIETDEIDTARQEATAMLDRYIREVAPWEDEIEQIEADDEHDALAWDVDGETIVGILRQHERLLDAVVDIAIAILEADGTPSQPLEDTIEELHQRVEEVIQATEARVFD